MTIHWKLYGSDEGVLALGDSAGLKIWIESSTSTAATKEFDCSIRHLGTAS